MEKQNIYWTACRETGDFIEYFNTLEEAQDAINKYEMDDLKESIYTKNFYSIVDSDHCEII